MGLGMVRAIRGKPKQTNRTRFLSMSGNPHLPAQGAKAQGQTKTRLPHPPSPGGHPRTHGPRANQNNESFILVSIFAILFWKINKPTQINDHIAENRRGSKRENTISNPFSSSFQDHFISVLKRSKTSYCMDL